MPLGRKSAYRREEGTALVPPLTSTKDISVQSRLNGCPGRSWAYRPSVLISNIGVRIRTHEEADQFSHCLSFQEDIDVAIRHANCHDIDGASRGKPVLAEALLDSAALDPNFVKAQGACM
jgi:hypothetical protein